MNFPFILVAPQLPENIGAAARAMNTMGFDDLRLVTPCDYLCEQARRLAHCSTHILENATVHESFNDAIQDLDFIVGATARRRGKRQEYFSGEELPGMLQQKGSTIHKNDHILAHSPANVNAIRRGRAVRGPRTTHRQGNGPESLPYPAAARLPGGE